MVAGVVGIEAVGGGEGEVGGSSYLDSDLSEVPERSRYRRHGCGVRLSFSMRSLSASKRELMLDLARELVMRAIG